MLPLSCRALCCLGLTYCSVRRRRDGRNQTPVKLSKTRTIGDLSTYYMQNIRMVDAMNSEKNIPVLVMNEAGYVQKMPAVEWLE